MKSYLFVSETICEAATEVCTVFDVSLVAEVVSPHANDGCATSNSVVGRLSFAGGVAIGLALEASVVGGQKRLTPFGKC